MQATFNQIKSQERNSECLSRPHSSVFTLTASSSSLSPSIDMSPPFFIHPSSLISFFHSLFIIPGPFKTRKSLLPLIERSGFCGAVTLRWTPKSFRPGASVPRSVLRQIISEIRPKSAVQPTVASQTRECEKDEKDWSFFRKIDPMHPRMDISCSSEFLDIHACLNWPMLEFKLTDTSVLENSLKHTCKLTDTYAWVNLLI